MDEKQGDDDCFPSTNHPAIRRIAPPAIVRNMCFVLSQLPAARAAVEAAKHNRANSEAALVRRQAPIEDRDK